MNNNNKILFICEKRLDTIGQCNKDLIDGFEKSNINVTVVEFNNHLFKYPILNIFVEIFNMIRLILLVRPNDFLLFTDPLSINILSSLFLRNKKYTIFYHYEKDPFYYKYLPFTSYRKILNMFDRIFCISKFSQKQLCKLGIQMNKSKVVYCGVDHNMFYQQNENVFGFDYILSNGSEEPRKNMKNILHSFRLLKNDFPNIKLVKPGFIVNNHNREKTMSYIKKFHLEDSIVFTGYLEFKDIPKMFCSAKLLLYPSLLEGFGIPIVEALACGCPVVTSNRDPMKELVDNVVETVDPLKPREIYLLCKKILSDKKYRDEVVKKGLIRSMDFDWQKTAREMWVEIFA